jgi:hypothetical protein
MSTNQSNDRILALCAQRLVALSKFVTPTTPMSINGKPTTLANVIAIYQAAIDTRNALIAQRAALDKALVARHTADVTRLATDRGLRAWVDSAFGPASSEATEFGFVLAPPKPKSAATKATAVEKTLATRAARGTKGKRQKAKIHGTIPAPTAPAAPATTTPAAPPAASVLASPNGALNGAASANGLAGGH